MFRNRPKGCLIPGGKGKLVMCRQKKTPSKDFGKNLGKEPLNGECNYITSSLSSESVATDS